MHAKLLHRSWLKRTLQIDTSEGSFQVVYNGRQFVGTESVYVDGKLADCAHSDLWFASVFRFPLGTPTGGIEVRVWPWFTIRSFHLLVEDELLYAAGIRKPILQPGWAPAWRTMKAEEVWW